MNSLVHIVFSLTLSLVVGLTPSGTGGRFIPFVECSRFSTGTSSASRHACTRMSRNTGSAVEIGNATSDSQAYALQFLRKTLDDAQSSLPAGIDGIKVSPALAMFFCVFNYYCAGLFSYISATRLNAECLPSIVGFCGASQTLGIVYGLLGGIVLRQVEAWRRSCGGKFDKSIQKMTWQQACNSDTDELLGKGVLLGLLTISIPSRVLAGDTAFGERTLAMIQEQCTDLEKAFLQIWASVSSCSLVQGLVQQALLIQYTSMATVNAISNMPEDPFGTWWWPLVASGTALAPVAAVLVTASFEFLAYLIVCETLFPMSSLEAKACHEAVSTKRENIARIFALTGIQSDVSTLRAKEFTKLANEWHELQRERKRRREVTNFARVLIAATVYAASGGSLIAPVLTNIAVTDSVLS